ncbi:hypothetical protein KGM_201166 [Danaus plexippus plexippus]|uniref:Uncharacterized protein n=1 Tax=Danaus plexippus plexippus TaxID=278856 RepID=A0A212F944_DANPL|nr:hypothetical protein KGM_201166 [Danaus plexippus plexippus]
MYWTGTPASPGGGGGGGGGRGSGVAQPLRSGASSASPVPGPRLRSPALTARLRQSRSVRRGIRSRVPCVSPAPHQHHAAAAVSSALVLTERHVHLTPAQLQPASRSQPQAQSMWLRPIHIYKVELSQLRKCCAEFISPAAMAPDDVSKGPATDATSS